MTMRHAILAAVAAAGAIALLSRPPIAQDQAYHVMADRRPLLGIPNALNVLSNIPFAVAGVLGLLSVFSPRPGARPFNDPWERWPYAALFAGTALTTAGSAYYHLAPDNARLVWDRLPMTVGFMGLLTAVVAERSSLTLARRLFVPLLAFGAAQRRVLVLERASGRRRSAAVRARAVRVAARRLVAARAVRSALLGDPLSLRGRRGLRGCESLRAGGSGDLFARASGERPLAEACRRGRRCWLYRRDAANAGAD